MDRLQNTDLSATPPEPTTGETGYQRVAVAGQYPASNMHPYYLHMLIEEIRNVIVAAGIDPNYVTLDQLVTAIETMIQTATPDATEALKGLVQFATEAQHVTGTSTVLACNPAGVKAMIADSLAGGSQATVVLTSSGTYTVPAGVFAIEVECVGVGGSGGNQFPGSGGSGGGGGGAGGYARKRYSVTPGQEIAYTITGVATTFNGTLVANAGGAGTAASISYPGAGGIGGTASGGDINIKGGDGSFGSQGYPGTDGGGGVMGYGGTGGSCPVGFGARSGEAGAAYGGGGGGGGAGVGPGAGGPGAVIIREFS